MRLPLVVNNFGDVVFFLSKEAAGYLEALDVENGEYVGYEADGKELKVSTYRGAVFIEPTRIARYRN